MLLYLFTLCRTNSADFKRSLGVEDGGDTLPAGVVYLSANIPVVEADDYSDAAKIISKASSKLERSGLLLSDEDVLVAMNSELDAKFLAGIKKNAKSGLYEGSAAASGEKFAETYDKLEAVIKKIASELRVGNADATPLNHKRSLPCDYCQARPICRRTDRGDGEDL
jgi:ATP-dependent helicase/nuclease subunit B